MTEQFSFGLIGFPLGHSISPVLHRAALDAAGLQGDYYLIEVPPLPEGEAALVEVLNSVRRGERHGLNVTIPHKQNLFPYLDDTTPAARSIGAVNVVFCQGERLMGDNTDAAGFLTDLKRFLHEQGRTSAAGQALVLGAGGSARAVVHALDADGWAVHVAARRIEQAQALAAGAGNNRIRALSLDEKDLRSEDDPQLIVNTTPLGMFPHINASPWPDKLPLPADAVVYDLVYNPPETLWMQTARSAGLPTCSGLGMLVEQAALSFERWTGRSASREAMHEAATAVLKVKGAS